MRLVQFVDGDESRKVARCPTTATRWAFCARRNACASWRWKRPAQAGSFDFGARPARFGIGGL
jgi:hypothetical protein